MTYRDVLNRWLDDALYSAGSLSGDALKGVMQFQTYLQDGKASDSELYDRAIGLRNALTNNKSGHNSEDDKEVYLCPLKLGDGTIAYIDRNNGSKPLFWVKPTKNGPEFYGKKQYITMLGGRNELGGIIKMTEDGDVVHDGNYVMKR